MFIEALVKVASAIVVLVVAVLANEYLARRLKIKPFLSRKMIHILGSTTIAASTLFMDFKLYIFVALVFVPIMLIFRSKKLKSLSDRKSKSYGEVLFPVGIGLAALIASSSSVFVIAVLTMGISDTFAFLTGKYLKSPKLILGKTLLGSLAFLISALIIALIFAGFGWRATVVALLATITELVSPYGLDNALVPSAICIAFMVLL